MRLEVFCEDRLGLDPRITSDLLVLRSIDLRESRLIPLGEFILILLSWNSPTSAA